MSKTISWVAAVFAIMCAASVCRAQTVEWQSYDADAEIPDGALRVRLDKGYLLCKGTAADAPEVKNAWRDIGTANNGGCRTQRVNKDLQRQEEFYLLVAGPETAIKWQLYDADAEIPEGALRVRLDKGSLLCKGTAADAAEVKNAWRDIGTVNNGVCRTRRANADLHKQEEFYLLVAELKSGDTASEPVDLFGDIITDAEELAGVVGEWTAAWDESAQTVHDQYGAYAGEYEFAGEAEIATGDMPPIEGTGYPVDPEILNAIYRAAAGVDLYFGSVRGQLDFMRAFLNESSFAEEYADVNQELAAGIAELEAELGAAEDHWVGIMQRFDHRVEGTSPAAAGEDVAQTLGHMQRAALKSLIAQNSSISGLNSSISRSEMATGGWNLSKGQVAAGRVHKQSKKKHNNRVAAQEDYVANYSVVAWGTAFIASEVQLLNSSLVQFVEVVRQAQTAE